MTRFFIVGLTLLCLPISAFAQSTEKSLPKMKLDEIITLDAAQREMRECLEDPETCKNAEFKTGKTFSLEDVKNLGIELRAEQKAPADTKLPSIDLEVLFAFASDELTPSAKAKLNDLSAALNDPKYKTGTLIFIGHTDNVGSAAYNDDLSLRRAQSAANHVRHTMNLPDAQIEAVGRGFQELKNQADPASAQNRRVQLLIVPNG